MSRLLDVVDSVAPTQHGLVARRQLLRAGVPATTIDSAVSSGRLIRAEVGVYQAPGSPRTVHSGELAVVLAAGPGAVMSHRSAAARWLLAEQPKHPELTVPRGVRFRRPGWKVHESFDLHLADPGVIDGVPVTSIGRTILDCARFGDVDVECLIDGARRRHDISRTLLPAVVARHAQRGRPGVQRLRAALLVAGMTRSDFERLMTRWLVRNGVAEWELNHRTALEGFGPVEIDVAWPIQRVALELEGADHRDRTLVHTGDTVRQNALTIAGWRVLRCTYPRWLSDPDGLLLEIQTEVAGGR